MVELRKRKTPPPALDAGPAKKKTGPKPKKTLKETVDQKVEQVVDVVKDAVGGAATAINGAASEPKVGEIIDLEGFGGDIETQDGKKTTLKQLVDESKAGVVLFTYPKASTPGCTKQACSFRDGYSFLTSSGLSIYGLSSDGPKANSTFKNKYTFPYDLICNPSRRGVFIIDKSGKVLEAFKGGPEPTVDATKKIVDGMEKVDSSGADETAAPAVGEDKKVADVAADVADTAAKLDG
ncbi:AhpC-TSA-domain-containing protein [Tothia fuscella]|uniref:thioredoxin-dependent peroxiredoxin n=1 Tax=Tothia fuscella TaxID=1048955 RepID=A0A9P4NFB5_9PEZI|nr:AhpC-TSA-domain-containing protein [Tothia fuscella]